MGTSNGAGRALLIYGGALLLFCAGVVYFVLEADESAYPFIKLISAEEVHARVWKACVAFRQKEGRFPASGEELVAGGFLDASALQYAPSGDKTVNVVFAPPGKRQVVLFYDDKPFGSEEWGRAWSTFHLVTSPDGGTYGARPGELARLGLELPHLEPDSSGQGVP